MTARPVRHGRSQRHRGFSYVEVVIATALLAVALVPMMQALQIATASGDANDTQLRNHFALRAKLEAVLADSYSDLLAAAAAAGSATTASTFSDTAGTSPLVLVYLSFYDIANDDADNNPFTIDDADNDADSNPYTGSDVDIDILWVRVAIEGRIDAMETLTRP